MYTGTRDLLGGSTAGGLDLVRIPADSHAELGREIVAPGQKEYPWMQSSPIINGMPRPRLLIDGLGGTR